MPTIRVLDKHVAELIAAGEVVERPASVVKELVENSIDAGASSITVEIKQGGITYLRITDNGCGIAREEVPRAFLRHATSKVWSEEDLGSISTLGFRGEALASIAAMARVEMLTRTSDDLSGTRCTIQGGGEAQIEEAGCPVGTTIVVRDLFYNTPARMKFLKKDITEGNSVAAVLDRMALSHPEVAFRFIRDGSTKLQAPGDGKLLSAIYAVYGREFASGLVEASHSIGSMTLEGYISKPECAKGSRSQQSFYINGRLVNSRTCAAALEEAYKHSIMVGRFPYCVLNISLPPMLVDVNVHPAKTEVRFADERAVFDLVYYGCKTTLNKLSTATAAVDRGLRQQPAVNPITVATAPTRGSQQRFAPEQYRPVANPFEEVKGLDKRPAVATLSPTPQLASRRDWVVEQPKVVMPPKVHRSPQPAVTLRDSGLTYQTDPSVLPLRQPNNPQPTVAAKTVAPSPAPIPKPTTASLVDEDSAKPDYRIIGELFDTYILLEQGDILLLVDKHAAHERLIYERLRSETDLSRSQLLLSPITVTLDKESYDAAVQHLDIFTRLGFVAEDFGEGALLVREAPLLLEQADVAALIEEIAAGIANNKRELTPSLLDDLFHSVACRSAIKAGQKNTPLELAEIIRLLERDPTLRHCPHGRPISIALTRREVEKLFGRV